ncbi:uncharacterized protein [Nicotiana sylvestris]|uniref:uncharacterized protein n=1 Tax=Nicotiana sylvestris TaxID=4096 RepID=UPI00388C4E43
MDKFRFNTENAPDVLFIQNLKKKPMETFREYVTRWKSEGAKVRPALEKEQMNRFFIRAQDPQYYERLMLIESQKFSDIIKLGERIEEGIKNSMVTNFEALQEKRDISSVMVNPNKSCVYHSGMKGHTIDECHSLKDKIQALIDNKIIVAKEPASDVRNNPLPNHMGGGVHMIEIENDWDPKGLIGLITKGDDPKKPTVTLNPIVVQIQPSRDAEVNMSIPLEFETPSSAKTPALIEVEFGSPANVPEPFEVAVLPSKIQAPFGVKVPIPVAMSATTSFHTNVIPWDYTIEARRKGKAKSREAIAAHGMIRTDKVYTPEHLAESSKQASGRSTITEDGPDDLWRKIQAKEYSIIDQLNKTPVQISILALLQSSDAYRNALLKVLSEAYVLSNITGGEMANMVGQVLESHKITFHEDELPPEGLSHNTTLHITMQYEDYFITRILIDGGSGLNIFPLVTLRTLGKSLHEIKDGAINVKAFDGSQRSTIGEISLCLQMGPTWFDVEFQVIDVMTSYNLLLGRSWIHAAGVVASTLHQAVKFEWNHQEVIIHGDSSNPIYSRQTIPAIGGRKKIGGETYHHIERIKTVDKDKWWDNKIESILNWSGYVPGKGFGKNLQGIAKTIKLKKHGTTFGLGYEYTWKEFNNWSPPLCGPYYPLEQPIPYLEQTFQTADVIYGSEEEEALAMLKKDATTKWTDDCQRAFYRIKEYLSTPPVLVPPEPSRPLLLYLAVLDGAFGCVLRQHDETGRKEQAIYYLSKKFTPYEAQYSLLERTCCAMTWGQALADHLTKNPMDGEYESLKTYFPKEEISFIGEDIAEPYDDWRMFFDRAANFKRVGIGSVLVLETGQHYPELRKRFTKTEFQHVLKVQNVFADALATLSSMIRHPDKNFIDPIPVKIYDQPTYCAHVEEEVDGKPWFHDIKEYLAKGEYPELANAI